MLVHSQRGGSCVTITHNAFDPSVQTPLSVQDPDPSSVLGPSPDPLLVTSDGQDRIPVQTSSP